MKHYSIYDDEEQEAQPFPSDLINLLAQEEKEARGIKCSCHDPFTEGCKC